MVARAYHLSQPTAVKYANDAIDNLRLLSEVEANEDLVGFLAKPLKFQAYQYPDDENIQALIAPILAPFLEQADKIAYTDRESADQPLSTRVSRTVEEKFQGGTGVNITPPPSEIISSKNIAKVKNLIEKIAQKIGIRGYARIDVFVQIKTGNVIVIEINTLPGLTPSTVIFHQALAENPPIYPLKLLEKIIKNSGY